MLKTSQKDPQTGSIEPDVVVLARTEGRPRSVKRGLSATRKRSFFAVSGPFFRISAAKERAQHEEHEGKRFLTLPTSEMLRFSSAKSDERRRFRLRRARVRTNQRVGSGKFNGRSHRNLAPFCSKLQGKASRALSLSIAVSLGSKLKETVEILAKIPRRRCDDRGERSSNRPVSFRAVLSS